jgi:hypothetical protein
MAAVASKSGSKRVKERTGGKQGLNGAAKRVKSELNSAPTERGSQASKGGKGGKRGEKKKPIKHKGAKQRAQSGDQLAEGGAPTSDQNVVSGLVAQDDAGVKKAGGKRQRAESGPYSKTKLSVTGLPETATNDVLLSLFRDSSLDDQGGVKYAFVVTQQGRKDCTGEGFVQFASEAACKVALLRVQGKAFMGRRLRLEYAKRRQVNAQRYKGLVEPLQIPLLLRTSFNQNPHISKRKVAEFASPRAPSTSDPPCFRSASKRCWTERWNRSSCNRCSSSHRQQRRPRQPSTLVDSSCATCRSRPLLAICGPRSSPLGLC